MTSDLELNRKLAIAIGWREDQIRTIAGTTQVQRTVRIDKDFCPLIWVDFYHADWRVIGPIAQKFDCFPFYMAGMWWAGGTLGNPIKADTPQRAIAMAVIQGAGK